MTIALDDRIAIHDVLALHGHLSDRGETNRFHEVFADVVRSMSKSLGVRADGTCVSVTYHDVLRRLPEGWRVARRSVFAS